MNIIFSNFRTLLNRSKVANFFDDLGSEFAELQRPRGLILITASDEDEDFMDPSHDIIDVLYRCRDSSRVRGFSPARRSASQPLNPTQQTPRSEKTYTRHVIRQQKEGRQKFWEFLDLVVGLNFWLLCELKTDGNPPVSRKFSSSGDRFYNEGSIYSSPQQPQFLRQGSLDFSTSSSSGTAALNSSDPAFNRSRSVKKDVIAQNEESPEYFSRRRRMDLVQLPNGVRLRTDRPGHPAVHRTISNFPLRKRFDESSNFGSSYSQSRCSEDQDLFEDSIEPELNFSRFDDVSLGTEAIAGDLYSSIKTSSNANNDSFYTREPIYVSQESQTDEYESKSDIISVRIAWLLILPPSTVVLAIPDLARHNTNRRFFNFIYHQFFVVRYAFIFDWAFIIGIFPERFQSGSSLRHQQSDWSPDHAVPWSSLVAIPGSNSWKQSLVYRN